MAVINRGGGGVDEVATPVLLTLLSDTGLKNGFTLRVTCHQCAWRLDKARSGTADGVTLVNTLSGTGRWVRCDIDNDYFTLLGVPLYVNEAGGTVSSDYYTGTADTWAGGSSLVGPLKTVAELNRRLKNQFLTATIDCYVPQAGLTEAVQGPISIRNIIFKPLTSFVPIVLAFHGVPTVVRSGTVTTYNGFNTATGALSELDDAGAVTTDRNRRIINTTAGARLNSSAWYGKNPNGVQGWTAGSRITSEWGKSNYGASGIFGTFTATPPLVGDTFDVQTLPGFPLADIAGVFGGLGNGVVFDQLQITPPIMGLNIQNSAGCVTYFYNCDINSGQTNVFGATNFINCSIRQGGAYMKNTTVEKYAGIYSTVSTSATSPSDGPYAYPGAYYTEYLMVAHDQCRGVTAHPGSWVRLYGGLFFNIGSSPTLGVHGSMVNGNPGCLIQHKTAVAGSQWLIGKWCTRTGYTGLPGSIFTSNDWTKCTITGGNNFPGFDFELNKDHTTLCAWDATTRTHVGPIVGTWTLMNTSVAGGGFGGYASDPPSGAKMSTENTYP